MSQIQIEIVMGNYSLKNHVFIIKCMFGNLINLLNKSQQAHFF